MFDGRRRVAIERVTPQVDGGRFPVKRSAGDLVEVEADVFADGHDLVLAELLYRPEDEHEWRRAPMRLARNDRYRGSFTVTSPGVWLYTVAGWIDRLGTLARDLVRKATAGQEIEAERSGITDLLEEAMAAADAGREALAEIALRLSRAGREAAAIIMADPAVTATLKQALPPLHSTIYQPEYQILVERETARFSAWYEFFPRSAGTGGHSTFDDCIALLPAIARMGFDVVYLPPIHPIGRNSRKGRNNSTTAAAGDPGSPWAIGSEDGGHKSIHPDLGTIDDFDRLVREANKLGLEIALDLAYQCSRDHPYLREHPEWFRWRPDGAIQYAENPPKKYEDVVPFNFETDAWRELWDELLSVPLFWAEHGVNAFRVDNPHTKPFAFWEWLLAQVRRRRPEVIFLAEAFTRPKVMYRLAKVGFSQSYTYFTWRNTREEIMSYLTELTEGGPREFFRPSFWPNTPDILPEFLQFDGRAAFTLRLILAATLSSNYGVYGPAFELLEQRAVPGTEEYFDSEKYEIRRWERDRPDSLAATITRLNRIRRENPALRHTDNLEFCPTDNDYLLAYVKQSPDGANAILAVINLDPFHRQSGWVNVPIDRLLLTPTEPYLALDLLSDDKHFWQGENNYVQLDPAVSPAHLFRLHRRLRREADFDYFL